MYKSLTVAGVLVLLSGCGGDNDGDGLKNGQERRFGSDPNHPDVDNDLFTDDLELEYGTDPNNADSDGDGYLDGEEYLANTSPLDADSVIYQGGWPFNADKSQIPDPGWEGSADEGNRFPRFSGLDQFGDMVDLYDFANDGRPVMLCLGGPWSQGFNDMARFLAGEPGTLFSGSTAYEDIPDKVTRGDVHWITVVDTNDTNFRADIGVVNDFAEEFDIDHYPVLLDDQFQLDRFFTPNSFPYLVLLNSQMEIVSNKGGSGPALLDLVNYAD